MDNVKEYEIIKRQQAEKDYMKTIAQSMYSILLRRFQRKIFKHEAIIEVCKLVIEEAEMWKETYEDKARDDASHFGGGHNHD